MARLGVALCALALAACGDDAATTSHEGGSDGTPTCERHELRSEAGECCPAAWIVVDGSCVGPGVPPDMCAEGFVAEGDGCVATMPPVPCGAGEMALPGDAACAPIMECGAGAWGDIEVGLDPQYVDASYVGGNSDGTMLAPWTTIQEGVTAAAPGAVVAVAEGSYGEAVRIENKPVLLRGRCPERVTLSGAGTQTTAILILGGDGSEVSGMTVTGPSPKAGVGVTGSLDVVLSRLRLTGANPGITIQDDAGATSAVVERVLCEDNLRVGLFTWGSQVTIRDSVLRRSQASSGEGAGLVSMLSPLGVRADVVVEHSVMENNADIGVFAEGASLTLDGVLSRGNGVDAPNQGAGIKLEIAEASGERAIGQVTSSVIEGNGDVSASTVGSDLHLVATVLRDSVANRGLLGRGVIAETNPVTGALPLVTMDHCLVERNNEVGFVATGADVAITSSIIRDTGAQPADGRLGFALSLQVDQNLMQPTSADVRGLLIERATDLGVLLSGSAVTMDAIAVLDTRPQVADQLFGRGIHVQTVGVTATLSLTHALIDHNSDVGVTFYEVDGLIQHATVRNTAARTDGLYGDGIVVSGNLDRADALSILDTTVSHNARAGVASFAGAAGLANLTLECNAIALALGTIDGVVGRIDDLGGNSCGCDGQAVVCKVLSSDIAPPVPLP